MSLKIIRRVFSSRIWLPRANVRRVTTSSTTCAKLTAPDVDVGVPPARTASAAAAAMEKPYNYDSLRDVADFHSISLDHQNRYVNITWDNGTEDSFPFVWLRDNCRCPACFEPDAVQRLILMRYFNTKISPKSAQINFDTNTLDITWEDGHQGSYDPEWLQYRSFSEESKRRRASIYGEKKIHWNADFEIPRLSYDKVANTDEGLLDWLTYLDKYGLVLLTDTPSVLGRCIHLANRVAFALETHYGREFTVQSKENPSNAAYTCNKLGLHNDLPFYTHVPGIQLLHCMSQENVIGGENQFSDAFHTALQLKSEQPDIYELLSTVYVDYCDIGEDHTKFYKVGRKRIIETDQFGLKGINYNHAVRDKRLVLPLHQVQKFYVALKTMDELLYKNSVQTKLRTGDIIAFDNIRVLHGRNSYSIAPGTTGDRHLEGCYINWDEALCRARVLKTKLRLWEHNTQIQK